MRVAVCAARDRIAMADGGVLRVFDASFKELTSWDLGDLSPDLQLLASESGVILAAEDGLRSWSWEGVAGTSIAFDPWGGGLRGDVSLLHGALWSIHIEEGAEDLEYSWILSRFEPSDLRLLDEANLTRACDLDPLQLAFFPLTKDQVGIVLYDAPEYLGNLVARARPDGLHVEEGPPKPEDMFDPIPLGAGRWLVETEEGTTLVDTNTMQPLACAREQFDLSDSGEQPDSISAGFAHSDGTFFVHTGDGFLGRLRMEGGSLHLERLNVPGTGIKRSSMNVHNIDTGFRGTVTREVTDIRSVEPVDDARLLTVHRREGDELELRIFEIKD